MRDDFSDSTLVLVGHGSTLNAESSRPTWIQAAALRDRRIFARVVTAFWKEHPTLAGALRQAFTPRVFVVPLFISEGYFTEEVIPRELGMRPAEGGSWDRVQSLGGRQVHYCGPVGTHGSMTQVILSRAEGIVRQHSMPDGRRPVPSEISLFIAGHGTGSNENSRRAIEVQVDRIRGMEIHAAVHGVFMEEEPRIAAVHRLATTPFRVVVPFFISDGLHSYEDIPVMLGAPEHEVRGRFDRGEPTWINPTAVEEGWVWYTPSIGLEPHLSEVILERVRESAESTACK